MPDASPPPETTPAEPAQAASAPATRPPDAPAPEPRWARAGIAVVLLAVLVAFLPALRCEFVHWDDDEYVTANPDVASPSLARILDPSNLVVSDWTPLPTLTYAAERALFGPGPLAPHATNVLLHLLCVWLLWRLLRDVGLGAGESLVACLLFGVHPLQVESVAWVSARKNLLACAAGFAFLRAHLAGRFGAATVWIVLALLSKGTAAAFPLIAAGATALGFGAAPRRSRAVWCWVAAWTLLGAARGAVSAEAQAAVIERTGQYGLLSRMATMGVVLATQARQLVWPSELSILYSHTGRSFAEPAVLGAWALVAALGAAAIVAARRDRRLAFAGVLAALAFLPTANVFPGPFFQQDRYLHVSLAGIAVLAVAALRPLARFHRSMPAAALAVWCLAVGVPATVARTAVWRTNYDLWNDTCLKAPGDGLAWSHLGTALFARGEVDDAIVALARAASIPHPESHRTIVNLATALHEAGRSAESREAIEKLLRKRPQTGEAHAMAGLLAEEAGDSAAADDHFAAWQRLKPEWVRGHLLRAAALLRRGDAEGARADAVLAARDPETRDGGVLLLAAADLLAGRHEEAFATVRATWPPDYSDALVWAGLGDRVLDLGRADAAETAYLRSMALAPDDPLACYRLAVARDRKGDAGGARDAAQAAVERTRGAEFPWLADARRLADAR